MTLDPNMFLPQAAAGRAVLPADASNGFFQPVCQMLGAITPDGVVGPTVQIATALVHFDILFPTGAVTQSFTVTTPDKIEIVDVIVRKDNAGAANTVQVFNGGTAITDAIAAAVNKAVTRAGTIDVAQATINAGASFIVTNTFAAGDIKANVTVVARRI
jgi:hypothetical protein